MEELADKVDGRFGDVAMLSFNECVSGRGPKSRRPKIRVLGIQPASNSPWLRMRLFKAGSYQLDMPIKVRCKENGGRSGPVQNKPCSTLGTESDNGVLKASRETVAL